jgi:hypothetical protein
LGSSVPDSAAYAAWIHLAYDVSAGHYFEAMDSISAVLKDRYAGVDEYVLVHANPRILDSLRSFDYYNLMERGRFVRDPNTLIVLRGGDSLGVPDSVHTARIRRMLEGMRIDVNIPAFRIRLLCHGDTLLDAPVRVGRNERAWLAVIGKTKSLRTPVGEGEIVRIARDPYYVNPRTGKRYRGTTRDDGQYTLMPRIPWLEPVIAGQRSGALIHPTTNRETLGRAYSNGCVGTREDDAWMIYYHAPLGTPVTYRYDLEEVIAGDTVRYGDVYGPRESR